MIFPIRDNNPTYRKPILTITLIVANSLIFLAMYFTGSRAFDELIRLFGYTPYLVFSHSTRFEIPLWIYLTPLTSMFIHGGWLHLIGNMLFLWIFGNNVEDYFGPVKFLIFYLLSGLAAIAVYSLFSLDSQVPLVGASGAIAGVMGAYLVLHPRAEITCLLFFFIITFVTLPAKVVLGIWFAIQLAMSLTGNTSGGGVAWLAHVGGFIFGWVVLKGLIKLRGGPTDAQRVYRVQW